MAINSLGRYGADAMAVTGGSDRTAGGSSVAGPRPMVKQERTSSRRKAGMRNPNMLITDVAVRKEVLVAFDGGPRLAGASMAESEIEVADE